MGRGVCVLAVCKESNFLVQEPHDFVNEHLCVPFERANVRVRVRGRGRGRGRGRVRGRGSGWAHCFEVAVECGRQEHASASRARTPLAQKGL